MLATYASAALICAASLLVGRAILALAGRRSWTWLEPAIGLGAIVGVAGLLARAPGRATTATIGIVALLAASVAVLALAPRLRSRRELLEGLPTALAVTAVLSIPFAVSARWGLLGIGLNNDIGLHLAWVEWLRSDMGPAPFAGYPMGPHGLAAATAAVPGIGLGQAFVGQIFAITIITGLTALGAVRDLSPVRRLIATTLVAVPYLAASYFAQGAFKETYQALFVLTLAIALTMPAAPPGGRLSVVRMALPYLAIAGGVLFSYSFAGLAWPIAIAALWSLTQPAVRRALAPRRLLRFIARPLVLLGIVAAAAVGVLATVAGPFGFGGGFNAVAGSNTYGPVSPVETLGIWWASNYRLDAPGDAVLPGLGGAIAGLALAAGLLWWLRRRELTIPIAFGACALLYVAAIPFSGDYSLAKALMIAAPIAMLVMARPLVTEFPGRRRADEEPTPGRTPGLLRIGWAALAVAFIGGAAYSSFLALRDAPIAPPGHGAELRAFLPIVHGKSVLYAGQDRYAAYELMGADTHVPLVEFPDAEIDANPEKPFDTGDAYSPVDFDSFTFGTLERFPYVITGRAAWNSQAPANFKRVATTPSYILWERTGKGEPGRRVLVEGTDPAGWAGCDAPEIRILLESKGRAAVFPGAVVGAKRQWEDGSRLGTGESTSQELLLAPGRWRLSLQYFSPVALELSAPGFSQKLKPALDGQRPNTISLANNGQFWPAGVIESEGGPIRFTLSTAEPTALQRLTGYDGVAYIGSLVATPAGPHRNVPLSAACDTWIDWYETEEGP